MIVAILAGWPGGPATWIGIGADGAVVTRASRITTLRLPPRPSTTTDDAASS